MLRPLRGAALALLGLLLSLGFAGGLHAQGQGRLQGTVVDEKGDPIADVAVTITSDEIAYENKLSTDKKGRFTVIFVDATRAYTLHFEKQGYQTTELQDKVGIGSNTKKSYTVPSTSAPAAAPAVEPSQSRNPAINLFNEGVVAYQAGDAETAKQKFNEAVAKDGELAAPYAALAGLYLEEKNYEQAKAMANRTLELEPDNSRAIRVLYDVYHATGDEAQAAALLAKLKSVGGGTDAAVRVFNEGADAARLGDLDGARKRFEEAVQIDPELAPAHAALARILLGQKHYQEAIAAGDKALDLEPGRADVLKVKYEAYRGLGDDASALRIFQEMVASDPAGTAKALFDRGVEMFNAGNTAGAKTAFEQAILADPKHAKGHYMLGLCYVNAGENPKAKEQLQRFLELAPDDPDAGTAKEMLKYVG